MTAPTATRRGSAAGLTLALATLLFAVAACRPVGEIATGKHIEVQWEERQLLLVGDARTGSARVFHMRAAPLLIGEMRAPGRTAVRDIRIDAARQRVWILGEAAVYVHDARTWSLIRRIPAPAAAAERLELAADGAPLLIGDDGRRLARIEPMHFTVETVRLAGN